MDKIEEDLLMIFGEEEAESYRQEKRQRTVTNVTVTLNVNATLQGSDLSDENMDRTNESVERAAGAAAGDTEDQAEREEGPFVPVDVVARMIHLIQHTGLPMADNRGEPIQEISDELREYLIHRYGEKNLPELIRRFDELLQSGDALASPTHRSASAGKDNAQDQQAGTSKKPASEQKRTQSGDAKASPAHGSASAGKANAQDQQAGTSKKPASEQKRTQSGDAQASPAHGSSSGDKANAQDQQAGTSKKPASEQKRTQSGDAKASPDHGSASGGKANAQDQQAGTSKKPASEQKDSRTQRKRKAQDPEYLERKNIVKEAQSKYKQSRKDLNEYEATKSAKRRQEQIRDTYEQLRKYIKSYKDFAKTRKLDVDEFTLKLDELINGTKQQDKQKIVEEESETSDKPQVHIENTDKVIILQFQGITITVPK